MALNSQRPMLCSFLYPPRCHTLLRTFTSTSPIHARQPKQPTEPSMTLASKQAMQNISSFPNDLGLLPDTLIMPTGPRLPGLFTSPQRRAALEWQRLKRRAQDLFTVLYYKFAIINTGKTGLKRPTIDFGKTKAIARELHHEMYSAFAEGDVQGLRKVCAQGLLASFSSRINSRARGERYEWTLERYIGQPRVVSHRVAMLPEPPMTTLRQAVVRIRSRQKLEKTQAKIGTVTGNGAPFTKVRKVGEEVQPKPMDEYLVIQKLMVNGKEGNWMVWGTTSETNVET